MCLRSIKEMDVGNSTRTEFKLNSNAFKVSRLANYIESTPIEYFPIIAEQINEFSNFYLIDGLCLSISSLATGAMLGVPTCIS